MVVEVLHHGGTGKPWRCARRGVNEAFPIDDYGIVTKFLDEMAKIGMSGNTLGALLHWGPL